MDSVNTKEPSCRTIPYPVRASGLPPPRSSLIVSLGIVVSLSLGLLLLSVASSTAQSAPAPHPDFADTLWLTSSTGLRKLAATDGAPVWHLPAETTLQPLAVDAPRGQVWSYGANRLKAFTFAGQLVRTVPVPPVSGGGDDDDDDEGGAVAAVLRVNTTTGSVWLGRGTQLLHLSATGSILHTLTVPSTIRTLAFDPLSGRLWRASTNSVQAYTEQGVVVSTLALGSNPTVRDMTVDELSGAVWVSVNGRLQRYATNGSRVVDVVISGVTRLVSDGAGGVWATTSTRLQRRSATGQSLVDVALPTSGDDDSPSVVALAADPVDHTVWVAQGATLRHYSTTGQVLHTRTFGTARLRAVALYTDLLPPTLSFLTPAAGAVVNNTRPPLTLSANDRGQGVDPSTVQLRANTLTLPGTCTTTPPELTCTPGIALPEGAVALSATVADFAGNLSLPATRQLTIDTTPPVAPQSGRITVSAVTNGQVTVSGSAGSVEGSSQVRITNPRTGQVTTVTATADGSFSAQLAAQVGDSLAVVVTDAAGNTSGSLQLLTADPIDVPFLLVWQGMNAALLAGDKATALTFLTPGAQVKYGPVFDALLPHMAAIIASYSPLQRVSISENVGEYAIIRTIDGANHLFLLYFVKDDEGMWKLGAM